MSEPQCLCEAEPLPGHPTGRFNCEIEWHRQLAWHETLMPCDGSCGWRYCEAASTIDNPSSVPAPAEVIHGVSDASHVTTCCGRTMFELPSTDRATLDPALVTCRVSSPASVAVDRTQEVKYALCGECRHSESSHSMRANVRERGTDVGAYGGRYPCQQCTCKGWVEPPYIEVGSDQHEEKAPLDDGRCPAAPGVFHLTRSGFHFWSAIDPDGYRECLWCRERRASAASAAESGTSAAPAPRNRGTDGPLVPLSAPPVSVPEPPQEGWTRVGVIDGPEYHYGWAKWSANGGQSWEHVPLPVERAIALEAQRPLLYAMADALSELRLGRKDRAREVLHVAFEAAASQREADAQA